jgi:hypothetical protein
MIHCVVLTMNFHDSVRDGRAGSALVANNVPYIGEGRARHVALNSLNTSCAALGESL